MKIRNKTRRVADQRGVALLFALGIMSLLLVLALAFVTNAAVNRRIAANNVAKSQTDALAASAVQRAVAMMNIRQKYSVPDDFRKIVSYFEFTGTLEKFADNLEVILNTTPTVVGYLSLPKYSDSTQYIYNPTTATDKANWQFIQDTTGRIIGRYAYAVVPESAKIDLAVSAVAPTPRLGAAASEIKRDDFPAWTSPGANNRWLSYDFVAVKNSLAADSADRDTLVTQYEVVNPPDLEAYWYDTNGDNLRVFKSFDGTNWNTEFYHRFELNRDWTSLVVDDLLGTPKPLIKSANGELNIGSAVRDANKIPSFSSDAIPYLRKIGDTAGTYASFEARRKQVAANLLAYNRALVGPITDDANNPTYFANVRAPYLDRFGFNLSAACVSTGSVPDFFGPGDNLYTFSIAVDLKAAAQLINIFTEASSPAIVDIENLGALTVTLPGGALSSSGGAIAATHTFTVAVPPLNFSSGVTANSFGGSGGLAVEVDSASLTGSSTLPLTFALRGAVAPTGTVAVSLPNPFTFDRVTVNMSGQKVDYVRPLIATDTMALNVDINGGSEGKSIRFAVDDPQENLNPGDWSESSLAEQSMVTLPTRATSPVFHAYIRHAPMKSPGELAYIPRGEAWSYLNLTQAATTDVNKIDFGLAAAGTSYATGDAEILDQIKMTPGIASYGKVDLSAKAGTPEQKKSLKMLLQNVGYMEDASATAVLDNMVPATAQIDSTKALDIATKLDDDALNVKTYNHKSAVAADLLAAIKTQIPSIAAPQDSELIGKILPLTKAGEFPTVIRLLVVAQSIRDVGGESGNVIPMTKIKKDGTATTLPNTKLGQFDVSLTDDNGIYFDEITGQTKVLATIVRDPISNKYHVISMDYLDK